MHKSCKGIRGKLKDNYKFKCQICVNQQTFTPEDWPGIELLTSS